VLSPEHSLQFQCEGQDNNVYSLQSSQFPQLELEEDELELLHQELSHQLLLDDELALQPEVLHQSQPNKESHHELEVLLEELLPQFPLLHSSHFLS
jgi:hypothetical protein